MRREVKGQLEFGIGEANALEPYSQREPEPETTPYRAEILITFSALEKTIFEDINREATHGLITKNHVVGSAIDHALVPANFIWRYRSNYCFPPQLYSDWNLNEVFARFYPTGWDYRKFLDLLEKHRPNFQRNFNPANLALEKRNIKRNLDPLWEEVAKSFELDQLSAQGTMRLTRTSLQATDQAASGETIGQIGARIVRDMFDYLVDDDQDYTYVARPDCLLAWEENGTKYHIQVQPDYIKRLREKRKSTKSRNIVTKRIVGDFKDSDVKDLSRTDTPLGQSMLVYNWLMSEVGTRFKQTQLQWVRSADGRARRVFLIDTSSEPRVPQEQAQSALEFLQADGRDIFTPMPSLDDQSRQHAQEIFRRALAASQHSRLSSP